MRARRSTRSRKWDGVGEHLIAVENTPQVHNMVVCTLCSCYPTDVLGLPPTWYKSFAYRSRAREGAPRGAGGFRRRAAGRDGDPGLGFDGRDAIFGRADASGRNRGLERGPACQIDHARLHDRRRPAEKTKRGGLMDGVHDMGGMDGFGKVEPEPNEPVFHHRWEGRVLAMSRAIGVFRAWTHRYQPLCNRIDGAVDLFDPPLLREMVSAQSKPAHRARPHRRRRGRRRARPAPREKFELAVRSHWPMLKGSPNAARIDRPAQGPAQFKIGDRVRTKNIHPNDAYTPAALCARPRGRGRAPARRAHFSRLRGCRQRRRSAVALHGALRCPRALGRGRGPES